MDLAEVELDATAKSKLVDADSQKNQFVNSEIHRHKNVTTIVPLDSYCLRYVFNSDSPSFIETDHDNGVDAHITPSPRTFVPFESINTIDSRPKACVVSVSLLAATARRP